jgi:hypothetical protein
MISTSSIKMFKPKAFVVAGVATLSAMAALPAQAITGFTGPYAPANWTFSNFGGSGTLDTTGAPGSLTLQVPYIDPGNSAETAALFIVSPSSGHVSFDWARATSFSSAHFYLNGQPTLLAYSNAWGGTGTYNSSVSSGDIFGFFFVSEDISNNNSLTISNFSFSAPTPPAGVPGPLPLFGAGAAYAWSRRLRRRLSNPQAKALPTIV